MSRSTQPKLNPVGPSHTVVLHHHVRPSGTARAERRPPQRAETRRGTPDVEPAKGGPGRIYPSRRCSRRPRAVLPLQPRRRWPPTRGQYRESLASSRGAAHEALPAKHPRATAAATAGCGDGRGSCRGEFFRTAGWASPLVRARSPSARTGEAAAKQGALLCARRAARFEMGGKP